MGGITEETTDYKARYLDLVDLVRIFFRNGLQANAEVGARIDGLDPDGVVAVARELIAETEAEAAELRERIAEKQNDAE